MVLIYYDKQHTQPVNSILDYTFAQHLLRRTIILMTHDSVEPDHKFSKPLRISRETAASFV